MIGKAAKPASAFDGPLLGRAASDAVLKLDPRRLLRNPVIFTTEIVAVVVTYIAIRDALAGQPFAFTAQIAAWLWFTVIFATFAEAVAEGRGRAQADALRRLKSDVTAKRLADPTRPELFERVAAADLQADDVVVVEAGDVILPTARRSKASRR